MPRHGDQRAHPQRADEGGEGVRRELVPGAGEKEHGVVRRARGVPDAHRVRVRELRRLHDRVRGLVRGVQRARLWIRLVRREQVRHRAVHVHVRHAAAEPAAEHGTDGVRVVVQRAGAAVHRRRRRSQGHRRR